MGNILKQPSGTYQPFARAPLSNSTAFTFQAPAAGSGVQDDRAAGALAAAPVRLGTITESAATSSVDDVLNRVKSRRLRFEMLKTVSSVLSGHRVNACQKVPSYGVQQSGGNRGISISAEGHAHFHGVGSCGDVWNCPVCASRIAVTRRDEIKTAMSGNRKNGGACLLVTWTFPHYRTDSIAEILPKFLDGMRKAKSWRGYKKARDQIGYVGQIRALEVTHSNANGWHPHCHEVWFIDHKPTVTEVADFKISLYLEWYKACAKVGLPAPSLEHGIDVQYREPSDDEDDDAAGAYIAKWGSELTFAHMKKGKKGSRSPWAILADLTHRFTYTDAQLFRQYSEAFKGRAQLYWSRGLKAMFGIDDVDDTEIADRPEPTVVRDLTAREWSAIIKTNIRPQVLEYAEFQRDKLDALIQEAVDIVQRWSINASRLRLHIERETDKHLQKLHYPDCKN